MPRSNRANMIHWYNWSEQAFGIAREQNKPVMLFLAAFWCRYCQRMDEEAFSETENIALLRAYFVSIRAENAQRPDLDVRYNQNGWPTIVFMTARGEAIIAANYLAGDQLKDLLLRIYMGQQKATASAPTVPSENSALEVNSVAPPRINESTLTEITESIISLADGAHGGYGTGQKFIQTEPNDFLLSRYEDTGNPQYLDHVCLTLDRMREQAIHDGREGGYFRTSTGPGWDQPHREKLLAEQAGLITSCLRAYRITHQPRYARMAEDIIDYLNAKLYDPGAGAFYGCEDFLRLNSAEPLSGEEFFTIIDRCIYTDANARAIIAYVDAASVLQKPACKERALRTLEFLRLHLRNPAGGMFHYFDDSARLSGWLGDQVAMGTALLQVYGTTDESAYLEEALELAQFILAHFKDPTGGYFDIEASGFGYLSFPLTLIEQNGPAASFFLSLAAVTADSHWREAALWALSALKEGCGYYGVHAAALGMALAQYLETAK
jgi:uncharacterized protein YyaL (SSP411 family)